VLVVAGLGGVLVVSAPGGPGQQVAGVADGLGDQHCGQAGDLVSSRSKRRITIYCWSTKCQLRKRLVKVPLPR